MLNRIIYSLIIWNLYIWDKRRMCYTYRSPSRINNPIGAGPTMIFANCDWCDCQLANFPPDTFLPLPLRFTVILFYYLYCWVWPFSGYRRKSKQKWSIIYSQTGLYSALKSDLRLKKYESIFPVLYSTLKLNHGLKM